MTILWGEISLASDHGTSGSEPDLNISIIIVLILTH